MKITRRNFLKMAAYAAAASGFSQFDLLRLQKAMAATGDTPAVIWFEGLGDSGCVVSLAAGDTESAVGESGKQRHNDETPYDASLFTKDREDSIGVR